MARAPGGLCTTRCQLFNTEITNTENTLRMKWFMKNRQRLVDNLRDEKLVNRAEQIREKYEEERQKRKREDLEIREDNKPLAGWRLPKPDGSVNLNIMKPVDPSIRGLLYEPKVESYITGYNYLRERYKDKPENRFYYPDCTSWLHGWHLTDYPPVPATKVGRNSIIQETFYRKNSSSLRRDSELSRKCQTSNPKDFNDLLSY